MRKEHTQNNEVSMYDVMPAIWENVSVDKCNQVVALFQQFDEEAARHTCLGVWSV